MPERYSFNALDRTLLQAAMVLLKKVASAENLRPAELVSVAKLQHAFSRLPEVTRGLDVCVSVTSPRRTFGEIETYHWWEITVEDEGLSITSAGHFYRPSTGGDTFTTMTWAIAPGEPADFADYREHLAIVPDVQSFPDAVTSVDFGRGYKAEITDSDNPLLEELADSDEESEVEADSSSQEEGEETDADESDSRSVKRQEMDGRRDNRVRNRNVEYHIYLDWPKTASGPRFLETVLDAEVGAETALLLVDQTDFAYQLAERTPFELRLKFGAVRTKAGPLVFLLWWVPPLTDGMPFALYEHLLNPTEPGVLKMLQRVSRQTHLHVLLIGPGQKLLDCYEFENTFHFDSLIPVLESSLQGPALNFEAAKSEYEKAYTLRTIFRMEPGDGIDDR
jgi:hypothetical protein